MGIFDKAKDALGDNLDKVESGIDQAADFVNDRTGGGHTDQISSGADLAKDRVADYLGSPDEAESRESEPQRTASRLTRTARLSGTARLIVDWDPAGRASAGGAPRLSRARPMWSRATARVPQSATPRLMKL